MIIIKNGRAQSVRTSDEVELQLRKEIESLSPGERETLEIMLKELKEDKAPIPGQETLLNVLGGLEYKSPPVDIRTFVKDPYFLGNTCDNIYPRLLDDLVELFEGGYQQAIFTGAIGTGKTFTASIGLCRILYEISCLKDPHASYGIAKDTNISIVALSVNEELAKKVVFENIVTKLKASPYFQEQYPFEATKKELRFPNNLWIAPRATTDTSALGLNIISCVMDEASYMPVRKTIGGDENRAETIYASVLRRMKSRFERQGRLPGMIFVVSSKRTDQDFTAKRIKESKNDPTVFVRDYCLTGETRIPLLNGTEYTIEDLAAGKAGSEFWVYSLDPKTKQVVPGRAHSAHLTARQEPVLRVLLDNGEAVRATSNHPFMLRTGEYRAAGDLGVGDSLMPLYRQSDEKGYEEVAHPGWDGRWQKTHRLVAKHRFGRWAPKGSDDKPKVVHHVNHNKLDNSPENLAIMEWTAHQQYHRDTMTSLTNYVKSDEHRAWASAHMTALHSDPDFMARREERGRAALKALWNNEEWRTRTKPIRAQQLRDFHRSEVGRKAQSQRNIDRWDKIGRKVSLEVVLEAASRGESVSVLATRLGCSPAAITHFLARHGKPKYSELKQAAGHPSNRNHKVVEVRSDGVADVYDLTVGGLHNFALSSGIFVHNSTWDVKPEEYFHQKRFWVLCGNSEVGSRLLTDEEAAKIKAAPPDGAELIDVPEDFRRDFERDLEASIRDIAGISTTAIHPYIQRREKIREAIDHSRKHPFTCQTLDLSKGGNFIWSEMVGQKVERAPGRIEQPRLRPLISPGASRHLHVDIGLKKDRLGFCMAHVAGWKDVVRRTDDGREYAERAPLYIVDFLLQVTPPIGGEIILAEIRHLIYDLTAHGYTITCVSLDSFQSSDSLQILSSRGYNSQLVSVDTTPEPYDTVKTALYENRIKYYNYEILIDELTHLQEDMRGRKRKIDHPDHGSKDLADALAGSIYTLSQQRLVEPLPIMRGMSYSPQGWMEEQRQAGYAGDQLAGNSQDLLPFIGGSSGSGYGRDPFES